MLILSVGIYWTASNKHIIFLTQAGFDGAYVFHFQFPRKKLDYHKCMHTFKITQ